MNRKSVVNRLFPMVNGVSVTVIIVNWNCASVLPKCLNHLVNQTVQPTRILVMDNGSNDDSLKNIRQDEHIDIHLLGDNLGFAVANNRALSLCDTKYVALLNPDVFVEPDWLEGLLAAASQYPDVVALSSVQLSSENPEIVDGAGDSYHASGLVWREGYGVKVSQVDLSSKEVFSPCAAAALYRREALVAIGGFDEDYFCYVEDVDLGFRLRLAGYRAMLVGDAIVHHVGSASTGGQRSDFCVYHGHRNLVWTFVKNMPGPLFWLLLPLHLVLNVATIAYFVLQGQGRVIWRAKWDAIKDLPKMWQKRRDIQRKRVVSCNDIWRVLNKRYLFLV